MKAYPHKTKLKHARIVFNELLLFLAKTMLNAILYAVETKLSPSGFNQSEKNAWRSVLDMLGRNFRQGLEAELTVLPTAQQMELVKTSWTDIVSGAGALQDLTYLFDKQVFTFILPFFCFVTACFHLNLIP